MRQFEHSEMGHRVNVMKIRRNRTRRTSSSSCLSLMRPLTQFMGGKIQTVRLHSKSSRRTQTGVSGASGVKAESDT